jgi:hypothetical protein
MSVEPPSVRITRSSRYRLTLALIAAGRPMTVAELTLALKGSGRMPGGRTSKVISDALRWEVRRGRVRRLGRGIYVAGEVPRSTQWWMRDQVRRWELEGDTQKLSSV